MLAKDDIRSILIFRALQLGDLLCSIPAIRALRASFPDAHIAIAGLPWMKMLKDRFPRYLDEFIWFPGYPGLPEQPFDGMKAAAFITGIYKRKFDLVLQMQGNGSIVNPLIALLGGRHTAGFCTPNDYCPDRSLFMQYPEGIHEIHRHLKLMQHLGIPTTGDELEFPLTAKDEQDLIDAALDIEPHRYICVHPGSRGTWRQWPTAFFARVADDCSERGWRIVLTGTTEEMPIVEEVAAHMKSRPVIAAGKTNLGAAGVLLTNAAGLISNCTGVAHIAAAVKTRSVIISMDGEPHRWGPLDKQLHKTIDWTRHDDLEIVRLTVAGLFASAS